MKNHDGERLHVHHLPELCLQTALLMQLATGHLKGKKKLNEAQPYHVQCLVTKALTKTSV